MARSTRIVAKLVQSSFPAMVLRCCQHKRTRTVGALPSNLKEKAGAKSRSIYKSLARTSVRFRALNRILLKSDHLCGVLPA